MDKIETIYNNHCGTCLLFAVPNDDTSNNKIEMSPEKLSILHQVESTSTEKTNCQRCCVFGVKARLQLLSQEHGMCALRNDLVIKQPPFHIQNYIHSLCLFARSLTHMTGELQDIRKKTSHKPFLNLIDNTLEDIQLEHKIILKKIELYQLVATAPNK
jgi:hypothetical protein